MKIVKLMTEIIGGARSLCRRVREGKFRKAKIGDLVTDIIGGASSLRRRVGNVMGNVIKLFFKSVLAISDHILKNLQPIFAPMFLYCPCIQLNATSGSTSVAFAPTDVVHPGEIRAFSTAAQT
jgi:sorbitol-specific phosphotransferase system component IIBC